MHRNEFTEHGLDSVVTVRHADALADGFGLDSIADAVFLDLPEPWLALETTKKSLKVEESTKVCCFSPCIEQVQKTCAALRMEGFSGKSN